MELGRLAFLNSVSNGMDAFVLLLCFIKAFRYLGVTDRLGVMLRTLGMVRARWCGCNAWARR